MTDVGHAPWSCSGCNGGSEVSEVGSKHSDVNLCKATGAWPWRWAKVQQVLGGKRSLPPRCYT